MFTAGDRVKEGSRMGTVTATHTPGTVDVLFDDMEYAIRRQEENVNKIRQNPCPKKWRNPTPLQDLIDESWEELGDEYHSYRNNPHHDIYYHQVGGGHPLRNTHHLIRHTNPKIC